MTYYNKPGKNVCPYVRAYVRPYVRMSTIKLNAATNQIVVFVRVDEAFTMMTFKVIRGQGKGHVSKNDDFQNLSRPPFFKRSKKFRWFLKLDQNNLKSLRPDF